MTLEELFEGEISEEEAMGEVFAYLAILILSLVFIASAFSLLVKRFNKSIPWNEFFYKRLFINSSLVVVVSVVLGLVFGTLIHEFMGNELPQNVVYIRTTLFLFITSALVMGLVELRYISEEKKELEILTQKLEKENIETLYNSLKNQVNPHFLFNSLSVLSSLIHIDTEKADEFIQHFSKIYRYALELNDEKLVTLGQELNFIESYLFLQKIRLGKSLNVEYQIDLNDKEYLLPPMSLQIVVENVLKHNIISKSNPMTIEIKTTDENLIIKNKLSPKENVENSTGIGLENIKKRYEFLKSNTPKFITENGYYSSLLPLINK